MESETDRWEQVETNIKRNGYVGDASHIPLFCCGCYGKQSLNVQSADHVSKNYKPNLVQEAAFFTVWIGGKITVTHLKNNKKCISIIMRVNYSDYIETFSKALFRLDVNNHLVWSDHTWIRETGIISSVARLPNLHKANWCHCKTRAKSTSQKENSNKCLYF